MNEAAKGVSTIDSLLHSDTCPVQTTDGDSRLLARNLGSAGICLASWCLTAAFFVLGLLVGTALLR